jgi:hypothetical protein
MDIDTYNNMKEQFEYLFTIPRKKWFQLTYTSYSSISSNSVRRALILIMSNYISSKSSFNCYCWLLIELIFY